MFARTYRFLHKLPSLSTVRVWFALNLWHIGVICAAIGGLGPRIPGALAQLHLIGITVPPNWLFNAGTVIAICGGIAGTIANPPLWFKVAISILFPVTPEMHDAALDRIVLPPIQTSFAAETPTNTATPAALKTLPPKDIS